MDKINVEKAIAIHAVYVEETSWMNVHSHGLNEYSHPELQIHCMPLFYREAARIINEFANYLLNSPLKRTFKEGEKVLTSAGHQAILIRGDEENQLRIKGLPPKCEICHGKPQID